MSGAVRLNPLPDPSTYGPNAEKNSVRKADDGLFFWQIFCSNFLQLFQKGEKNRMTYILTTPMTGSRRGLFVPLRNL